MSNAEPERTPQLFSLNSPGILAAAPIAAYSIAFLYEYGYTEVFEIPPKLITLELVNIFLLTIAAAGMVAVLLLYLDIIVSSVKNLNISENYNWGLVMLAQHVGIPVLFYLL